MLSEVMFMSPNPDPTAAVKPLLLLLAEYPNSYKGTYWGGEKRGDMIRWNDRIE